MCNAVTYQSWNEEQNKCSPSKPQAYQTGTRIKWGHVTFFLNPRPRQHCPVGEGYMQPGIIAYASTSPCLNVGGGDDRMHGWTGQLGLGMGTQPMPYSSIKKLEGKRVAMTLCKSGRFATSHNEHRVTCRRGYHVDHPCQVQLSFIINILYLYFSIFTYTVSTFLLLCLLLFVCMCSYFLIFIYNFEF